MAEVGVSSAHVQRFALTNADRLQAQETPTLSSQPSVTSPTARNRRIILMELDRLNSVMKQLQERVSISLPNTSDCRAPPVQDLVSAPMPTDIDLGVTVDQMLGQYWKIIGCTVDETFVNSATSQLRELENSVRALTSYFEVSQQTSDSDSGHDDSSSLPPLPGDVSADAVNGDMTDSDMQPQQHFPNGQQLPNSQYSASSQQLPDDTQQLADARSDEATVSGLCTNRQQEAVHDASVEDVATASTVVQPSATQVDSELSEFAAQGSAAMHLVIFLHCGQWPRNLRGRDFKFHLTFNSGTEKY